MAKDLSAEVALKVFQEALRILVPGGIMYVFDVGGESVALLPDEYKEMLAEVPQAGVKQTVHEIQTQEIMRENGYDDRIPQKKDVVRWVAVKPRSWISC